MKLSLNAKLKYWLNSKKAIYGLIVILVLVANFTITSEALAQDNDSGWWMTAVKWLGGKALDATVGTLVTGLNSIVQLIISICAILLGIAGSLFDIAIWISIVNFKFFADLDFVDTGWQISRDLANISFIFILLYIAISTILQLNSSQTKSLLGMVITIAILVNFSAVFTKIAIDASNILSITFYKNIGGDGSYTPGGDDWQFDDISQQFMPNIEKMSGGVWANGLNFPKADKSIVLLAGGFLELIFMLVMVFIFIAVAVLFFIRTIVLIILIITSPLAFLGLALPKYGNSIFSKWSKELTSQLLFAPIFMLLFYITLKAHELTGANITDKLKGDNMSLTKDLMGNIMAYILMMGLAIYSIIISKSIGAHGGNLAGKLAGGATFGSVGLIGRKTIGSGAYGLAQNEKLQAMATEKGVRGFMGRNILKTFQKTAKSSFDMRAGGPLKASGVDAGKAGGKGGYKKYLEDFSKKEVEFAKSLGSKENQEAYAKNLGQRKSFSRLFMSVPQEHTIAMEKIGRFKEKAEIDAHNEKIEQEIAEIKERTGYEVLEQEANAAKKRLDAAREALSRAKSENKSFEIQERLRQEHEYAINKELIATQRLAEVTETITEKKKDKKKLKEKDSLEESLEKMNAKLDSKDKDNEPPKTT